MMSKAIEKKNKAFIDKIINQNYLAILCNRRSWYCKRTRGTTSTESCNVDGEYLQYVYFDWGANFEQVKMIVKTPRMQQILRDCLIDAQDNEIEEYAEWDSETTWPFLFYLNRFMGRFEKEDVIADNLPMDLIAKNNKRIANWYKHICRRLAKDNQSIVDVETEPALFLIHEIKSGKRLQKAIMNECNNVLFHSESSPLKELLMCIPSSNQSFIPFVLELAKSLAPNSNLCVVDNGVADKEKRIICNLDEYFDRNDSNVWM